MINRGEHSNKVIDDIIKKQEEGYNIFPIRGNHEQLFINLIDEPAELLNKYAKYYKSQNLINKQGKIKTKYLKFLLNLPYYLENENCIFVHAALDLTRDDIFANKHFMVYSRFQRGNKKKLNGKRLIHGHLPQNYNLIKENIKNKSSIIGIDNGCIFGDRKKEMGRLICLDTDLLETISVKNID